MIRYRTYIKKARSNIIGSLKTGSIDQYGQYSSSQYQNSVVTENFIKVDQQHFYELKKINEIILHFWVCEYDENQNFISPSIEFNIIINSDDASKQPKKYIPSQNAKYIKLQISNSDTTMNYCMFLRSENPTLIHDSMSPEESSHLINANLHLEDSSSGTFEFVIHKKHSYYKQKINLWTDTFYITRSYSDGSERIIWDGRAITEEIDIEGNKAYHCEGSLGYLNDIRVLDNSGHEPSLTIYEFINDYIIDRINTNDAINNRFDRSLYSHRDPNLYPNYYGCISSATIIVDQGTEYLWATSKESGMKWINNIKDSFGAHVKIRYRKDDSPTDNVICRCLTMVQDFDRKTEVSKYSESWYGQSPSQAKKIEKGSIYYYPTNPIIVVKALSNFYYIINDINYYFNNGYLDDITDQLDTYDLVIEDGAVYKKVDEHRYPKMNATFGLNVFDARKVTEIKDFASVIIPRGVDCNNGSERSSKLLMTYSSAFINGIDGVVNFSSYYLQDYILDPALVKQYGFVEAAVDFENANTPKSLKKMGEKWFKDLKKNILSLTIEMTLSNLNDNITPPSSSDPLADPEYLDIWTQIYATIPELGITEDDPEKYFISAMDIPLDDYYSATVTLVNKQSVISDNTISAGDIKGSGKGIIDTSA